MKKFWENYKFSFTLLLGIFVGALIGVVMGEKATVLEPIGQIFLNLMFTIVVPDGLCVNCFFCRQYAEHEAAG